MTLIATDWTIDRQTGNIRYVGSDHGVTATADDGEGSITTTVYTCTQAPSTGVYQINQLLTGSGILPGTRIISFDTGTGGSGDYNVSEDHTTIGPTGAQRFQGHTAGYDTVIELHRWLWQLADDAVAVDASDELDITDLKPSSRATDNYVTLLGDFNIDDASVEHTYDGSIVQGLYGTQETYDGIVNFGNVGVVIQLQQNGTVLADDYWNYNIGGINSGSSATIMTDSSKTFVVDGFIGYVIRNMTDGSKGLITDNDANTITVEGLYGGSANTWSANDEYLISEGLNSSSTAGISHRFMLKTQTTNSGTATASTSTTALHNSSATFVTDGVQVDDWITNSTQSISAQVTIVVSETELTHGTIAGQVSTDLYDISRSVDGKRVIGTNRTFAKTYGEFKINGSSRGNNVLALSDAGDLNNTTSQATIAAYDDVTPTQTSSTKTTTGTNSAGQNLLNVEGGGGGSFAAGDYITAAGDNGQEYLIISISTDELTLNRNLVNALSSTELIYKLSMGYVLLDIEGDGSADEPYYLEWEKNSRTINQFFERMKLISTDATPHYIAGLSGELFRGITHEVDLDARTSTFYDSEPISWDAGVAGSAGTGHMYAIDSVSAGVAMWFQLLTGGPPGDNSVITGTLSSATGTVIIPVVDRSSIVKTPFVGTSTGSALIASYGLALDTPDDVTQNDTFFALGAPSTAVNPPNNVTFSVTDSVTTGEDYLFIAEWDSTSYDDNGDPESNYNQFLLSTALTTDNITAVIIKAGDEATIPSDTPASGYIRVQDDNGFYRKLHFDTLDNSTTFSIDTTDGQEDFAAINASVNNNVFITYFDDAIDESPETFTYVYGSVDRKFVIKVRDGGISPIKEYIATGTMQNTGGNASVIRTADV